jgi:hypothetical protein
VKFAGAEADEEVLAGAIGVCRERIAGGGVAEGDARAGNDLFGIFDEDRASERSRRLRLPKKRARQKTPGDKNNK